MAIDQMTNSKTFADWRDITNAIITALGDLALLPTTNKDSIVDSVTEIEGRVDTLETNNTGDQNLFESVTGDTGTVTAGDPADTFAVVGGFGITTAAAGGAITIANSDSGSGAVAAHNVAYDHDAYDAHLITHAQGATAVDAISTSIADVYTFPLATYQGAKLVLIANDGTNIYASEILIVHDGTNVQFSESSVVDVPDAGLAITYSADINTGNVRLRAVTGAGTATIKYDVTLIPV